MWETNHALTPRPKCGVNSGLQSNASVLREFRHLHLEALTFLQRKNITQRPVFSSSSQNYFSDLIQGVWAHPTLQGYGKAGDHYQPKGIAAHYFTSFQTQHCGNEYPEEKMQQAPPAVVFSHLTANLLREREEQSLRLSSRCPHPGTLSFMQDPAGMAKKNGCTKVHLFPAIIHWGRNVIKIPLLLTNPACPNIHHWASSKLQIPTLPV